MLQRAKTLSILVAFMSLLALPAAADDLVGSWDCTDDGFILTINRGGTYMSSNPTSFESASHGAWEQAGMKTYDLTDLAFIYGEDGNIELLEQARVRARLDGDTLTAEEALLTIFDLDGTVVAEIPLPPSTCHRIKVIPLPED